MSQTSAPRLAPDATLGGKYRIVRVIGEGGMGAVYEAENTWTQRRVAIKLMTPDSAQNPEFVRRFMREARSTAKLKHDNVVDVLDMGDDPEGLYIVYEFLVGHDLRTRLLKRGGLPPDEALDLLLPVMDALVAVHALGVVHRDIKPENIFLTETPRGIVPKLIDFGIAKITTQSLEKAERTLTGQVLGTPLYMSPEQVMADADVDARSDIWSIAVVLYELLSGARPYQASSVGMFVSEILVGKPRPLHELAPTLAPELVTAIHKALKPRAERYATMQDLIDVLDALRAKGELTTHQRTTDVDATVPIDAQLADLNPPLTPRDGASTVATLPPLSAPATLPDGPLPVITSPQNPVANVPDVPAPPLPSTVKTAPRVTLPSLRWPGALSLLVVVLLAAFGWKLRARQAVLPPRPPARAVAAPPIAPVVVTPIVAPAADASTAIALPEPPAPPPIEPPSTPLATPPSTPLVAPPAHVTGHPAHRRHDAGVAPHNGPGFVAE